MIRDKIREVNEVRYNSKARGQRMITQSFGKLEDTDEKE